MELKVEPEGIMTGGSSSNSVDSGYENGFLEDSSTSSENSSYQQLCVFSNTSKETLKSCDKWSFETYDVSDNLIETVSARTFQYYANYLKELNLSRNKISSLPETICELKCLKVLNLSHNALANVPPSWKKMSQLRVLNLSYNNLNEAPECLELGMERLTSIDLSYNHISSMNSPMCLPFLQKLNLSRNNFGTLPLWLFCEQCRSLTELDMSLNFCLDDPKLDTNIYVSKHFRTSSLKNLKKINLSNAGITREMILCLSHFESLQSLLLGNTVAVNCSSYNCFLELPMNIFCNPSSIVELLIPRVSMASLPDDFCKLDCLRVLDLSDNPLNWLPESFGQLRSLQELMLSNCCLSYLPDSFVQLTCLTKLMLDSNSLTDISSQLSGLTSLQWLDVYNNLLEKSPINLELELPQLEAVDMAANFISVADILDEELMSIYHQLQAALRNSNPEYAFRYNGCKVNNRCSVSEDFSWHGSNKSQSKEDLWSLHSNEECNEMAAPYVGVDEENWDDDSSCGDDEFDPNWVVPQRYCLCPPGKYKFGWTPPIRHTMEYVVPTAQQVLGFVYVPGHVHPKTTRVRHVKVNQLPVAEGQYEDVPLAEPTEPSPQDTLWDLLKLSSMFVRNPHGPHRKRACRFCHKFDDCWHHGIWIYF